MDTKIQQLLEKYNFSHKDIHDFHQIYSLLPSYKRVKVVENFSEIAEEIWSLKKDLLLEQEILFWETLENIESRLQWLKKTGIISKAQKDISLLKDTI